MASVDMPCPSNWSRYCCCAAATAAAFKYIRSERHAGLKMLARLQSTPIYAADVGCDDVQHLREPAAVVAAAALPVVRDTAPAAAQNSQTETKMRL
jgi:hypothetical protein